MSDESPVLIRRIRGAEDPSFPRICDLWHRTWYAHSEAEAHLRYRLDLLFGQWGKDQARIHVLEEGGRVLSGLVVFHLRARLAGEPRRVAGIAMVATEPAARGRGLARKLLDSVHEDLRREDAQLGLLFSDIDPAYYGRMGYETWPMERHQIPRPPTEGAEYRFREVEDEDLGLLVDLHGQFTASWEFAVERDRLYWTHLLARERGRQRLAVAPVPTRTRWLAFQGDHAVAHAAFIGFPDRLVLEDAGWLPGHGRAVKRLMGLEAQRRDQPLIRLTATRELLSRLELVPVTSEPIAKMMLTTYDPGELRGLSPRSHPLLGTDWF